VHTVTAWLAQAEVFRDLDPTTLQSIGGVSQEIDLPASRILYSEGDAASDLFVVARGEIMLAVSADGGLEITLETRRPGEIFGEAALWDQGPRMVTAMAVQPSTVLAVPQDKIRELVHTHAEVADALLRIAASVMRRSTLNVRTGRARPTAPEASHHVAKHVGQHALAATSGERPTSTRFYESTHIHDISGGHGTTFVSIPRRPDLRAVAADLIGKPWTPSVIDDAHDLGIRTTLELSPEQLPAAVLASVAPGAPKTGELDARLAWGARATKDAELANFAAELISQPLVPVEASPLGGASLAALVKMHGSQAALGVLAVKVDPILLVTVPLGIVILETAVGAGAAAREVAYGYVRRRGRRLTDEDTPPDEH
jgi:CRP-like cAMP-binding protein